MNESAKLSPEAARQRLEQLASLLRQAPHLDAETQRQLADLLDELGKALGDEPAGAKVAESAAQVAHALQNEGQPSRVTSAMRRLEESAARAEAEAPLATGIVRRFLEALADLGI
jgi:Pex19 protein family